MSSPGVSVSYELPSFAATQAAPIGLPPGVIGTSWEGPAFVPITLGSISDFAARFGEVTGSHAATLAVAEWFKYQSAATYMRILGVGTGARRLITSDVDDAGQDLPAGSVKHAGFIVGAQQVNTNGLLGNNPYAYTGGSLGRTYFLGAFMSESKGYTTFSDAGIQARGSSLAAPILRGVLFAASGVMPALSGCYTGNASTASAAPVQGSFAAGADGGSCVGSLDLFSDRYTFVLLLNGHIATDQYPNTITASLNPAASFDGTELYISTSLNTDPEKLQEAGHYLHTHYDFWTPQAKITGSGVVTAGMQKEPALYDNYLEDCVFLITGSMARNQDDSLSLNIPNFENFSDRFRTAFSPTVISQKINRIPQDLFTFHILDDGAVGNEQLKITIKNIEPSAIDTGYGTFDVDVRKFWDTDISQASGLLGGETFPTCNLDPESDNYIARRIGDNYQYFDFDKNSWAQRMVRAGKFANQSVYIRVEMNPEVDSKTISNKLLPVGFRGPYHLTTSGSSIMSLPQHPLSDGSVIAASTEWSHKLVEPPIPYRENLATWEGATEDSKTVNANFCWGFKTERITSTYDPNDSNWPNYGAQSFCTYFPHFSTARKPMFAGNNARELDADGTIYDSDRFNNNMFTLENVQIHTRSDADVVDTEEWAFAMYRRDGVLQRQMKSNTSHDTGRFLNVTKDFKETGVKSFLSFTMPVQAGFDGFNIFDSDKARMTNNALTWELDDPRQGGKKGPTVSSYVHALNLMVEKSETDIQLLAIPGVRVPYITNMATEVTEEHFDAMYIMDLQEYDIENNVVTSSDQTVSIDNTAQEFKSRILDSSFVTTYFPNVSMLDPVSSEEIFVAPSVAVLGAIGNNDRLGYPWSAPCGNTRGILNDSITTTVKYLSGSETAVNTLYNAAINPIIPTSDGLIIYSQKTLMAGDLDSAMERVNVRRMLIDIRRRVRKIARSYLFEQNREVVLKSFSLAVQPILAGVQATAGIERYKVIIDTTTTTQTDIENNIVRGKIFLQPYKSDKFVSIDFDTA